MTDIFYFTQLPVNLTDVVRIAEANGYRSEIFESNKIQQLTVFVENLGRIAWIALDARLGHFDSFEELQRDRLSELGCKYGFIVSYHRLAAGAVLFLLKKMLCKYGGWIGIDDNTFEVVFDISDVQNAIDLS